MSDRAQFSLAPTRQLRRRNLTNRLVEVVMLGAALAAVAVLVLLVATVVERGHSRDLEGLLHEGADDGLLGGTGGIANAIVGTIVIVAIATLIALPVGILVAVYTSEFAHGRVRRARSASCWTSSTGCRRS